MKRLELCFIVYKMALEYMQIYEYVLFYKPHSENCEIRLYEIQILSLHDGTTFLLGKNLASSIVLAATININGNSVTKKKHQNKSKTSVCVWSSERKGRKTHGAD